MTNKQELNNEELEKVSGGNFEYENYSRQYPNRIKADDVINHTGKNVLITKPFFSGKTYSMDWIVGTLRSVYEESSGCSTHKVAQVSVIDSYYPEYKSGTHEYKVDDWCFYTE